MKYTLAITSCDRHDLLKRTLQSFIECCAVTPFQTIICEDGDKLQPDFIAEMFPRLGVVKWITNESRRGQAYTIDRLYSEIQTELIFWCEDDWLFHESGFLSKSAAILNAHKDISMVALRSDWNHPLVDDPRGFQIAEPYWGGIWGGTCWNPGLRRRSDFARYGSYGRHVGYGTHGLGHEKTWSKRHLDDGFRIAALPAHCYHIGGDCSRAIEPLALKLPKILIAVPACHEFQYGRWESEESPHYNQATAWEGRPYGTDIHISGPNPRISAIRETWWRDIEPFSHHVTGKFFYGEGGSRDPLGDEVFLPVCDDYASLPQKTIAIAKWALENGFEYVLKVDDDTLVYVERAVLEILNNPRLDYGGYCNGNIASGGPGYWLSKRAMRHVAQFKADHWAEDCSVGICLERHGITPESLPGHCPGFAAHWFWPDKFDATKLHSDTVTAHAVQPEIMREWYAAK